MIKTMKSIKLSMLVFTTFCVALAPSERASAQKSDYLDIQSKLNVCAQKPDDKSRLECFDAITTGAPQSNASPSLPEPSTMLENPEAKVVANGKSVCEPDCKQTKALLAANEPNYFALLASPVSNDLNDENHMEFYLSIKYPLMESSFTQWKYGFGDVEETPSRYLIPNRLYFIYNGLYDFYVYESKRYDSSPILSRVQNPGMSFEWDLSDTKNKVRLGWFHESNGQTLDEETTDDGNQNINGLEIFERRLDKHGEDYALASVSRGWDYASLRYESSEVDYLKYTSPYERDGWYQYHIEYRWFCDCQGIVGDKEDEIWWEPGNNDEISDYDGLRLMAERQLKVGGFGMLGRIEYKSGLYSWDAMSNISWKATLVTKPDFLDNFHLMLFYFDGYGKEPSTYQIETQYVGLGFELR